MLQKLVYVVSLIALSSTVISSANAAGTKRSIEEVARTPNHENQVTSPGAPKRSKIVQHFFMDEDALAEAGFNMDDVEPVNIAPRRLINVFNDNDE